MTRGESVTLSCSHPRAVRFFWLFKDDLITSADVTITGDKFQELRIRQVTEATVGKYSCHAIDAVGSEVGYRDSIVSIASGEFL